MKALVLSGGEMKGAYQAGAILGLARRGLQFDMVCGTSVGALNAAFLADRVGQGLSFENAADALVELWLDRVTGPDVLIERRSALSMAWDIVKGRWTGWLSLRPLLALMDDIGLDDRRMTNSPLTAIVSVASLETGRVAYYPASKLMAMASGTQPLLMKPEPIGGMLFYDGGLRDVAPLAKPIDMGATSITAVICQPADLPMAQADLSLTGMASRVLAILLNEILTNDIATATRVNTDVLAGTNQDKRYIPLTVLRPAGPLPGSITKFTGTTIQSLVGLGMTDAMALSLPQLGHHF